MFHSTNHIFVSNIPPIFLVVSNISIHCCWLVNPLTSEPGPMAKFPSIWSCLEKWGMKNCKSIYIYVYIDTWIKNPNMTINYKWPILSHHHWSHHHWSHRIYIYHLYGAPCHCSATLKSRWSHVETRLPPRPRRAAHWPRPATARRRADAGARRSRGSLAASFIIMVCSIVISINYPITM